MAPGCCQDMSFYPSLRPWADAQGQAVKTISPLNYSPEKECVPASSRLLKVTPGESTPGRAAQGSGALANTCRIRQGGDKGRGRTAPTHLLSSCYCCCFWDSVLLRDCKCSAGETSKCWTILAKAGDRLPEAQGDSRCPGQHPSCPVSV